MTFSANKEGYFSDVCGKDQDWRTSGLHLDQFFLKVLHKNTWNFGNSDTFEGKTNVFLYIPFVLM